MKEQTLTVMRHAKSDWANPGQADIDRPLTLRGQRDARAMGRWLRSQRFAPHAILSSPAARARETASLVAEALDGTKLSYDDELYLAEFDYLLATVASPPSSCWLLIGHNPGLESLVRYLDPWRVDEGGFQKLLPTAATYTFDIEWAEELARGCGKLRSHQRPKKLKRMAP